jgi:glycyl-tRNA synthetase beta subunit
MVMICAFLSHFQVCVENLCTKQAEQEVEVRGPPVSKAFDNQGNATKVCLSFSPGSLRKFVF